MRWGTGPGSHYPEEDYDEEAALAEAVRRSLVADAAKLQQRTLGPNILIDWTKFTFSTRSRYSAIFWFT